MTTKEFDEVVKLQLERCQLVLTQKQEEYTPNGDRLGIFKIAASLLGTTPKQALWGMLAKQLASLSLMCKMNSADKAAWNEKITDSINYLLFLRALVKEDMQAAGGEDK